MVSVLSGNRNFEGRIHSDVKMNYLASPPLCVAYALAGTHGRRHRQRSARRGPRRQPGLPARHLALRARDRATRSQRAVRLGHVPQELRRGVRRRRALELARGARGRPLRLGPGLDLRPPAAVLRRACPREPEPLADIAGARALVMLGDSVTTDHISPAGSIRRDGPAGAYLQEHGVERRGLQLLRLAARQPRGDDAGHLRQRPAAQPARAGHRGRRDAPPARRRAALDLRRRDALPGRGRAARRAGRQGVRLGLLTRLGGQGHAAARRARRDRRELRAHPPLEPRRHGRAAAAVRRRRERRRRWA